MLLLVDDVIWRPACFWSSGVVFRLNARKPIMIANFKNNHLPFNLQLYVEVGDFNDEFEQDFTW